MTGRALPKAARRLAGVSASSRRPVSQQTLPQNQDFVEMERGIFHVMR